MCDGGYDCGVSTCDALYQSAYACVVVGEFILYMLGRPCHFIMGFSVAGDVCSQGETLVAAILFSFHDVGFRVFEDLVPFGAPKIVLAQ